MGKGTEIVTKAIAIFIFSGLAASGAMAQPGAATVAAPSFDVASIKVSRVRPMGHMDAVRPPDIRTEPDRLTIRSVRLQSIIAWAYNVKDFQVTGPGWFTDERYDIVAKAGAPVLEEQLRAMLQTLVAERFKVELHRQTKETSLYALVVAKGGPKIEESSGDGPQTFGGRGMKAEARNTTMTQLADALPNMMRAPVLDMTGLKGKYNFAVDLTSYIAVPQQHLPGEPPPDPAVIISQAISDQLGLRLEPRKAPLEMIIVDHAEKVPVEN